MEKLFKNATRGKYRFYFKGSIRVEDLWDLSPQNLDTIYKSLTKELKQSQEESLLVKKTEVDSVLDDKINLVKYIVLTKLKEEDQRNKEREFKEKKQKILGLIADKQDNELQSKSIDGLKDMLESLK